MAAWVAAPMRNECGESFEDDTHEFNSLNKSRSSQYFTGSPLDMQKKGPGVDPLISKYLRAHATGHNEFC